MEHAFKINIIDKIIIIIIIIIIFIIIITITITIIITFTNKPRMVKDWERLRRIANEELTNWLHLHN